MGDPLITLGARRGRNIAVLFILALSVVVVHQAYSISLHRTDSPVGWLLLGLMLFLALYNLRKKLPTLPLGTSANWLQFHIYAGLLTIVLFVLHIEMRIPNGTLEVTLALLFLLIVGSGILGLALSRGLARRLRIRGEEVIYERIPAMRQQVLQKAEELFEQSISESSSTVIVEFYNRRLVNFFMGPRNFLWHLLGSERPRQLLLMDLGALDRYLSAQELESVAKLNTLIHHKDDLDYHTALQGTLKYWVFLHIPLTYSLLIIALLHAILASAYRAG